MAGVVTVTVNPSWDSTVTADRVAADRKTRCDEVVHHPGGGGLNVARVVHEVGGQATAVWTRGGLFGTGLHDELEASALTHVPVAIAGETRENFAVIESDSRRHFRFVTPGPVISGEELDRLAQAVRDEDPDLLVLSGSLPPSVNDSYYARLARVGNEQGARVVVDAHGAPCGKPSRADTSTCASPTTASSPNWSVSIRTMPATTSNPWPAGSSSRALAWPWSSPWVLPV